MLSCGSSKSSATTSSGSASPDAGGAPVGACDSVVEAHPPTAWDHLTPCDPVSYDTNPPSGGSHYFVWAAFQNYDFAVPQGFLVHSLEHGAVIYWYNCPEGCSAEVAQAEAFIAALPSDPLCAGNGSERRVILVPSPDLSTRWAASTWGYTLTADCFDSTAMRSFYDAHYGQGREDLCAAGLDVTAATCPE
jgi:hypothetical protein